MCDICRKSGLFTDIPNTRSCVISVLNQEYSTDIPNTRSCVMSVLNQDYLLISLIHTVMCDICLKSGIFTDIPNTRSCVISVLNQEYLLISLIHGHV